MMKKQNNPISATLLISAIALVVSGCGGGGGGGGGGGSRTLPIGSTTLEQRFDTYLETGRTTPPTQLVSFRDVMRRVTSVTPINGADAVYQSGSGTSASPGAGLETKVTTDTNSLTIELGADVTLQSDSADTTSATTPVRGQQDYTAYYLSESGTTEPRAVEAVAYTSRTATNADYATFGYWVFDQDDVWDDTNTVLGVFAHSGGVQTPAAIIREGTGTATYQGDAVGFSTFVTPSETDQQLFNGELELTATLGSSASIQGTISNIEYSDIGSSDSFGLVTLGSASIDNSPGGFFTGDATITTLLGLNPTGKWGGRFYGADAEVVLGTFGAGQSASGFSFDILGSFGAQKEAPTEE